MNNCVGAGNLKHFFLFLLYTWLCSAFLLLLLGWNYFFCADETCTFTVVLVQLVRVMTLLSVGAFLFTSSMLMNVCYGLMTGIGTIDRLKKKANDTMNFSEEQPIPLKDVFGGGDDCRWFIRHIVSAAVHVETPSQLCICGICHGLWVHATQHERVINQGIINAMVSTNIPSNGIDFDEWHAQHLLDPN